MICDASKDRHHLRYETNCINQIPLESGVKSKQKSMHHKVIGNIWRTAYGKLHETCNSCASYSAVIAKRIMNVFHQRLNSIKILETILDPMLNKIMQSLKSTIDHGSVRNIT